MGKLSVAFLLALLISGQVLAASRPLGPRLRFMASMLPSYFSSEWSFAQSARQMHKVS